MSNLTRKEFLGSAAKTAVSALGAGTLSPFLTAGLTGCSSGGSLLRKTPEINYNNDIKLINCRLVNVKTGKVTGNSTILIRNGIIVHAGAGKIPEENSPEIFDMKNMYVMPGLINGHCHMTIPPGQFLKSVFTSMDLLEQIKRNFTLNIEHGITSVRDMGGYPGLIQDYLGKIEKGSLAGPRVIASNSFLSVKGGYIEIDESDLHPLGPFFMTVMGAGDLSTKTTGMDDLKEKIRENIKDAGLIKVSSMDRRSLIAGKTGELPAFTDEELKYVFDYAEKNNLPVAIHDMTSDAFRRALNFPFNSFEHVVYDDYISDSELNTMKKKNMSIVPTAILCNLYATEGVFETLPAMYKNDFIINEIKIRNEYWESITEKDVVLSVHETNVTAGTWYKKYNFQYEKMYKDGRMTLDPMPFFNGLIYGVKNIQRMRAAGILIGCGTDSGVPWNYHGTLWREMEMYSRIGFTNAEILRCATVNNARIMGVENEIGSLERGKFGDMIVLKNNPLENISACRNPLVVFRSGKIMWQNCDMEKSDSGISPV